MNVTRVLRAQWDRAAAVVALGVGVLALVLGYIGVSSTAYTAEQIPYIISGGITGLFLLGLGATLYLSADIRDEWRKLDDIERRLEGARVDADERTGGPDHEAVLAAMEARLAALEARPARRAAGNGSTRAKAGADA